MIQFTIPIEPVAKGRPRFTRRGNVITPIATRRYEYAARMCAAKFRPAEKMRGPISLTAKFIVKPPKRLVRNEPSVKPDVDNFLKALMDALQDFWIDDAQVVEVHVKKLYAMIGKPRTEVVIAPFIRSEDAA